MKEAKERLDVLLVARGLFETREQAKRAVMAGTVYANEERLERPGEKIAVDRPLTVKGGPPKYVSRGGWKLEKALCAFSLDPTDKIVLDIGSSTGGFTDCALQRGAAHCYALDVGYNQLAWKIRQDPRVTAMERVNFRYSKPEDFAKGLPEMATIDVSFISLRLILPALRAILMPGGDVVSLVKPQFEAGREAVGKKGVVRDVNTHIAVLRRVRDEALASGFSLLGATHSPIAGGEGNIEFLYHLRSVSAPESALADDDLARIAKEAHEALRPGSAEK